MSRRTEFISGAACALILALAAGQPIAIAQPIDEYSGADFAGLTIPAPLQRADATIAAERGWVWSVGGAQRLYLEKDVVVQIGAYSFNASRASLWIEPLEGPVAPLWQVAAYFDTVEDPGADAAVAQSAERLLVTAIVQGEVRVRPGLMRQGAPTQSGAANFVLEGETRLGRYLERVARDESAIVQTPVGPQIIDRDLVRPLLTPELLDPRTSLAPTAQPAPIFAGDGVVSFYGPDRTLVSGDEESALVVTGGVVVQYASADATHRLQLTAESVVVFLDPGSVADILRFDADRVRGIYLEGDVVATDGEYTLRGPRFYYDLQTDRGVALDAVFWTYNEERELPLYVRADVIRQESRSQWAAGGARLANSSFFEPTFTIGATSVTLTRIEPADGGADRYTIDARKPTYRIGDVPVVRLPRIQGEITGLRAPRVSVTSNNGKPVIETRWDIYSLLGVRPLEGLRADLLLDGYIDRGVAVGADLAWSGPYSEGEIVGNFIVDNGEDKLSSGETIDRDNQSRGFVMGEHRERLTDTWTLFAEGAYVSDPAYLDAFYEDIPETSREFIDSLSIRYLKDQDYLTLQGAAPSNNFIINEYLLQSRGYQVERFPEMWYARTGQTLANGALVYSSDSRVGLLSASFSEKDATDYGLKTPAQANAGMGVAPDQSPADALRAAGYTEDNILRADTRHELSAPLAVGALNVEPFAVGRVTAYDTDFSALRDDGNDDKVRLWGGGGVRIATTMQRINNSAHSQLFDIDRIRHLITPSVTVFSSATTLESGELQLYDERVEDILNGTVVRAGLENTWQTKRGGDLGRSVDWLHLRMDYVWSSDETRQSSPIGRWYESRPEFSTGGEFGTTEAVLQVTDAVALTADWVFDFEENDSTTIAAGALIDHGEDFSSFIELRDVDPIDATYLHMGASYQLSARYAIDTTAAYDLDRGSFQSVGGMISRRFAQVTTEFGVDYDDIQDETTFSLVFRPLGADPRDARSPLSRRSRDVLNLSDLPPASPRGVGQGPLQP